jgi:hypothetical protein
VIVLAWRIRSRPSGVRGILQCYCYSAYGTHAEHGTFKRHHAALRLLPGPQRLQVTRCPFSVPIASKICVVLVFLVLGEGRHFPNVFAKSLILRVPPGRSYPVCKTSIPGSIPGGASNLYSQHYPHLRATLFEARSPIWSNSTNNRSSTASTALRCDASTTCVDVERRRDARVSELLLRDLYGDPEIVEERVKRRPCATGHIS